MGEIKKLRNVESFFWNLLELFSWQEEVNDNQFVYEFHGPNSINTSQLLVVPLNLDPCLTLN